MRRGSRERERKGNLIKKGFRKEPTTPVPASLA
jgi:hypothetical protein